MKPGMQKHGILIGVLAFGLVLPIMAQVRAGHLSSGAHPSSSRLRTSPHAPLMGDPSGGRVFTSPFIAENRRPLKNSHFRNNFCDNGISHCRSNFVGAVNYPFWGGALYWPDGFDYADNSDLRDVVAQQQHIISELENEANQRSYFELRQQENILQQPAQESTTPSTTTSEQPNAPPETPTRLIFLDQHHIDVHNYAIVGKDVYVLRPDTVATTKIPLSELDIPATVKENAARGMDFHVPQY